jgi:hypothetical protein
MDCSAGAEAYDRGYAEPGCHTLKVNVSSGETRYAEFGLDQMPTGENVTPGLFGEGMPGSSNFPHAFCAALNTGGTGGGYGNDCGTDQGNPKGQGLHLRGDLNKKRIKEELQVGMWHRTGTVDNFTAHGADFYMGADDNLDGGEHDGVDGRKETGTDGVQDGPSDGGAVRVFVHPQNSTVTPDQTNPVPVAGASFGSCADGICENATTYRQTMYTGTGEGERNVSDYHGKQWDPFECNGADLDGNLREWKAQEGRTYADPGVSIYEDPDAQASPIDPVAEIKSGLGQDDGTTPLYPLPGTYVGTCGVIVNGKWRGPDTCA